MKTKNVLKLAAVLSFSSMLNLHGAYAGGIHNFTIHQTPPQAPTPKPVQASNVITPPEAQPKKEDVVFTIVYGHVVVADLKGNQKTIERNLPIIASAKNVNDFIRSVPKHYRGANIFYNSKISYLLNKHNKLVFRVPLVYINGGSCFNLYDGKQVNTPDGFSGALINNIDDNKINIDMTEMKSLDNDKCEVAQTHHLYTIDVNSTNNLFSMGYDNQKHVERIIYLVNENRRHVKQNH